MAISLKILLSSSGSLYRGIRTSVGMGCVFLSKKKGRPCISGLIEPECCPHTSARCLRSIYYTHLSSRVTPLPFCAFWTSSTGCILLHFYLGPLRFDRVSSSSHTRRTITYHFTLILISYHAFLSSRVLVSLILCSSYYKTRFNFSIFFPTFRKTKTYSFLCCIKIKIDRYEKSQIAHTR